MPTMEEMIEEITAPGGRFEMETIDIRGVPTRVFKQRLHSLRELAQLAYHKRGDQELLVYGDERYTYREFFHRSNTVAAAISKRHDLNAGDRVAILSANNPMWAFTFWAALNSNLVAAALNGWWKADEIVFGLQDCGARILVTDSRCFARIREQPGALDQLDSIEAVYVIDPAPGDVETDPKVYDAALLLDHPVVDFPDVPIAEDDPAVILYTSGTTGRPKGAVGTHRSWLASTHNVSAISTATSAARPEDSAPTTKSDSRLLCVPLFHVSGAQSHLVAGLLAGWKFVLPKGRFEPEKVLRLIEDEKITAWAAVPTMVSRVCQFADLDVYDRSTVRSIGYGGAPAPSGLAVAVRDAFPNVVYQSNIYGLTETSGVSTLIGGQARVDRPGSVGQALFTVEIEIRDAEGSPVEAGVSGEVCVKGPHIISGYWNRPEATADAIVEGWLHTGDIGFVDDEGWLHITDRAKDMIIRGGENIYCVEIEDRLDLHPDVLEAAVVGVPHPDLGEEVRAAVQVRDPDAIDQSALQAWVAETLADFKVPTQIRISTEPLPRNATGKVLKNDLRSQLTD